MKNFPHVSKFFSSIILISSFASASLASDVVIADEMDTTVRASKDKMEYGEGSLGRTPSSLRVTQPGYDCFAEGCKSTAIQPDKAP